MAVVREPGQEPMLGDIGEDALVAAVVGRYPPRPGWLLLGPGDDAAVLDLGRLPGDPGHLVLGTDSLVQGRDFRLDWSSGHDLGVKLAAQNFADVAAMGARPLALLVSLVAPSDLSVALATGLADGLAEECRRAGAAVIGGDVSEGDAVVLTATAVGALPSGVAAVRRDGARPGDVVALAGWCGASAAGLALLAAGRAELAAADPALLELLTAHRAPRPAYPAGEAAARAGAHAMIDTSDGLLRDAARIARASGVTLDLDLSALPRHPALVDAAGWVAGADPVEWLLAGGEDHAMLACFGPEGPLPEPFRAIGRVLSGSAPGVLVDGAAPPTGHGWTHWSRGTGTADRNRA